jgi:hypothetical protein
MRVKKGRGERLLKGGNREREKNRQENWFRRGENRREEVKRQTLLN